MLFHFQDVNVLKNIVKEVYNLISSIDHFNEKQKKMFDNFDSRVRPWPNTEMFLFSGPINDETLEIGPFISRWIL